MGGVYSEIKTVTATIPSGAGTSNQVSMGGYGLLGILVPVITSGYVAFAVPYTGATLQRVFDKAGAIVSAATPGGTGGVALGAQDLLPLAGFQAIHISASVAQAADRNFVLQLKS